jgi:hypothetical protein
MFSDFFVFENRAVYEILWENVARVGQVTDYSIRRRRKDAICMPVNSEKTQTQSHM